MGPIRKARQDFVQVTQTWVVLDTVDPVQILRGDLVIAGFDDLLGVVSNRPDGSQDRADRRAIFVRVLRVVLPRLRLGQIEVTGD
jgi:hypothetical protein